MKKILLTATAFLMLFSCQNDQTESTDSATNAVAQRGCASQEVLEAQLKADPTLALRMNQIEAFTEKAMLTGRLVNGKVEIPVVVNVLYKTAAENISDAQIQSQIDVLNQDFNATNSDFNTVPALFSGVAANVGITFVLETINRKSTTKTSWGTRDAMKKTKQGGLDPTSPTTKLNMWACTIGGGILGYAQFPGGSTATDGVVIDSKYFGLSGSGAYPYNLGRTATHEVGHWMNLRHIWGDATCGSDLVTDTPTHNTANYGVPAYPHYSTCTGTPVEMTMNYMDYTDDRGMYMFSNGQKSRMDAIFVSGGARASFGI
ncbi:zinc metalloprotease [Flavobacterium gawalongense]|uniref:Zinc metalloprotease n=1 Tax=Flavobacterium gawalongense TaxID=2594432 RepID=A0A553BLG7_9FLAO|nr:zinc metalloprotease [Flavobacterium gawalongense]TRX00830.1 zinc metalloprotease [Flavobacterium gawalongense]TRX05130.1 zinc metalloprotease [Flavobacterium gawalongense]TRX09090.1 zinc metalloprotease [Flavobacterium gawalongense]TRX10225.1 zinc metalloprotease [Flavobacterium gawalongense]TRX27107.1 zinc metalloprotease [Flavobacterium gawalongense]